MDVFNDSLFCVCCSVRPRGKNRRVCLTCASRRNRENNPEMYAYHMLKKSAKKRKLPFTLEFNYFKNLCANSGYLKSKGRLFNSLTVERINPDFGYHNNNVMIVPKSYNSQKHRYEEIFTGDDLPF